MEGTGVREVLQSTVQGQTPHSLLSISEQVHATGSLLGPVLILVPRQALIISYRDSPYFTAGSSTRVP